MTVEIRVPSLGESIDEAIMGQWQKKEGEKVVKGEMVVELVTEDLTVEVVAPTEGTLQSIRKHHGDKVRVDEVLAEIDTTQFITVNDEIFFSNVNVFNVYHVSRHPKVFLVHGREDGKKHEVARYLEKLGLNVVILHERPNGGRTLISKFREESAEIEYAIVLMTPDDVGGLANQQQSPRARQNVVFELGFFIGKLGPERVCALVAEPLDKPSDFESVVYITFDNSGAWRMELARELHHAGIQFDVARMF